MAVALQGVEENSKGILAAGKRIHFNFRNFTDLLDTYLSSTHLHGCRYIVDKQYNILAPILWITLISLSFTFCVHLIFLQLNRFQDTPVLNVITSTGYPVWKSPFPAVVVCNHNVVYRNNTGNVAQILKDNGANDEDVEAFLNALPNLVPCDDCLEATIVSNLIKISKLYEILEVYGYDISAIMKEVAHPCGSMLNTCKWQAQNVSCTDIFKMIKTNIGYCCAFNYYATKEQQMESRRLFYTGGAGLGSGLSLTLDIEASQYISRDDLIPGATIFTHSGDKYPQIGIHFDSVAGGEIVSLEVEPSTYSSDLDIVHLKPKSRGCLFGHEGNLEWTNSYNSQTCFNECKANYIVKICDCIPFYYPSTGNARYCSFLDIPCLVDNTKKFATLMLSDDLDIGSNSFDELPQLLILTILDTKYMREHGIEDPEFCYCQPNCEEVEYRVHSERRKMPQINESCVVNIYYSSVAGIKRERTAIVTWDTLLGTIGGTFGLCMGGSIISVVEFTFYSIQAIFGRRFIARKKQHKSKLRSIKINVQPSGQQIQTLHM